MKNQSFESARDVYDESDAVVTLALKIEDVCRATGLGRTTIYGAIKAGDLVARKYGRRTIILATDLASFLATMPTSSSRSPDSVVTASRPKRKA